MKYLDILNEKKDEDILKNEWDYIVLGEILEHVDNPVEFLEKILKNYGKNIKNILITVPNILSTGRILEIKKNNGEMINSDHRYWFSPYTLLKVTERAGIKIENSNIYFTDLYIFNFFCLKKLYRIIEKLLNKKIFSYKFYDFATLIFIGNIKKNTK